MIRPALVAWQEVTDKLLALSPQITESQRDETIVIIDALLDERGKLQREIVAPFTAEEEVLGKKLVALEAEVLKKLAQFTKSIRADITEVQSKSDNMKNYVNPYGNLANDGMYYDTKQ